MQVSSFVTADNTPEPLYVIKSPVLKSCMYGSYRNKVVNGFLIKCVELYESKTHLVVLVGLEQKETRTGSVERRRVTRIRRDTMSYFFLGRDSRAS